MSVNHESLNTNNAPALEYRAVRNDSLSMFGAAIGGAVLGMLLTLLVLAIVNNGTLRFVGGERIITIEDNLARAHENIEAVSTNIEIVAGNLKTAEETLRSEMNSQNNSMDEIGETLELLDVTRQEFYMLTDALTEALNAMNEISGMSE